MSGTFVSVARTLFRSNRSRSESAVREEIQMVEDKSPPVIKVNYTNGLLFLEVNGKMRRLCKEDLKADFRAKLGRFDKSYPQRVPIPSSIPKDKSTYYCSIESVWLRNEQFVEIRLTP